MIQRSGSASCSAQRRNLQSSKRAHGASEAYVRLRKKYSTFWLRCGICYFHGKSIA